MRRMNKVHSSLVERFVDRNVLESSLMGTFSLSLVGFRAVRKLAILVPDRNGPVLQ